MNNKKKRLGKRQLAVVDDLFAGKMTESEILEKHNLGISVFRKWLASDNFIDELTRRTGAARRQSEMIIARFAPAAAAELVALTECEKEDVRRKACLDVITAAGGNRPPASGAAESSPAASDSDITGPAGPINLSPQLASRLLAVMAEGDGDDNE
jgi:hypothetical protein